MSDSKGGAWLVRKVDLAAAAAWLALLALAVIDTRDGHVDLASWCAGVATVAATLTAIGYIARRFDCLAEQTRERYDALEHEAFERGLRAGLAGSGVALLDDHQRI